MNFFKTSWHHLRRSPFQSLASLLVMTLTFFVITFFILVSYGLSVTLKYFETKPEITIFLRDGLTQTQVENLQKELASYPEVRQIKFISKENALELYRQQNQNNPLLTEMVTASILPASFEVSVNDPKMLKTISDNFSSKTDQVEEIIFEKEIVDSLISWSTLVRRIGLFLSIALLLFSFFIVLAIIGMKVTSHRDEIRISRLLGASRFYVERPFIWEGIFYGFFGSLIGLTICFATVLYFKNSINNFFNPVTFVANQPSFYLYTLASLLTAGSFIGYFAGWSSARRFIKF